MKKLLLLLVCVIAFASCETNRNPQQVILTGCPEGIVVGRHRQNDPYYIEIRTVDGQLVKYIVGSYEIQNIRRGDTIVSSKSEPLKSPWEY